MMIVCSGATLNNYGTFSDALSTYLIDSGSVNNESGTFNNGGEIQVYGTCRSPAAA